MRRSGTGLAPGRRCSPTAKAAPGHRKHALDNIPADNPFYGVVDAVVDGIWTRKTYWSVDVRYDLSAHTALQAGGSQVNPEPAGADSAERYACFRCGGSAVWWPGQL